MRVDIFIWSCFVNAFLSALMGVFVLFTRPLTKVKQLWSATCFAVTIWSIGLGIMSSSTTYSLAKTGLFILYLGSPFIPVFLFHTTSALLKKRPTVLLIVFYVFAASITVLNAMGHLCDASPTMGFLYYTEAKPLYVLFVLEIYGLFIFNTLYLWRALKTAPGPIKKQLKFLLLGTFLGFLGGQSTMPLVYRIPIFPYGNMFVPIYVLMVGYGMLRYQLMDFRMAMKKLAISLGITAVLAAISIPILWRSIQFIAHSHPENLPNLILIICVLVIILTTGPLLYVAIVKREFWLRTQSTAGLTHELRSPLANIQSAAEILEEGKASQLTAYTRLIKENTNRLETLISNLLQLAQLQSDSHELTFREEDLSLVVQSVADSYSEIMAKKGLCLTLDLEPNLMAHIDREKIEIVISNLLSNAIKFTSEGGIHLHTKRHGPDIQFSISDTGIGIPEEDSERIFDKFYQGKNATKGSGLGLAIAKGWVEAHGGRIWVEPHNPKSGTKILIQILPK